MEIGVTYPVTAGTESSYVVLDKLSPVLRVADL